MSFIISCTFHFFLRNCLSLLERCLKTLYEFTEPEVEPGFHSAEAHAAEGGILEGIGNGGAPRTPVHITAGLCWPNQGQCVHLDGTHGWWDLMAPVPFGSLGEALPLCQWGSDVLPPKRRQLRARRLLSGLGSQNCCLGTVWIGSYGRQAQWCWALCS